MAAPPRGRWDATLLNIRTLKAAVADLKRRVKLLERILRGISGE